MESAYHYRLLHARTHADAHAHALAHICTYARALTAARGARVWAEGVGGEGGEGVRGEGGEGVGGEVRVEGVGGESGSRWKSSVYARGSSCSKLLENACCTTHASVLASVDSPTRRAAA